MHFRQVGFLVAVALCCSSVTHEFAVGANSFYVAPTGGSDSNNGSLGAPFATFTKAITTAAAGDTIFARGGTYNLSTTVSISGSKNGTAANPFHLLAYPGETPVLDFRGQPYSASNSGLKGISLNGSYWHIKGLTIQYAADNGIAIGGSNNIVEQVITRQNQDSGIQISGSNHPSNNLILNCDSYANFDFGGDGENADGFAVKFRDLGPGNIISGVRSWENADDGFDFWQAENGIQVINSWSFHNGLAASFNNPPGYAGDSNGIKLGKDSGTHVLKNMLVWGNDGNGVDINGNATESGGTVTPAVIPHGVTAYNVTSALNGNRNFRYDENPTTTTPPSAHVIRNSISFSGTVTINPGNTVDHNTFAGPGGTPAGLGVAEADFVSIVDPVTTPGSYHPAGTGGDRSGVTTPIHATGLAFAPRLADGSLPPLDFLRLKTGSHLIDAGVNVGLPYSGLAPDLGWLETAPPAPALPGDYNGDNVVDMADYIVWRENTNSSATLPNDVTSGLVDDSDYTVWREHFGQTSGGGTVNGLSNGAPVPEPTGAILSLLALSGGLLAQRASRRRNRHF